MKNFPTQRSYYFLYGLMLLLVIIDRWMLLEHFTFQYVDDDQSIMWYGAKEFAAGNFHEPCFYGQSYNTMLESLFAVPLIWLGVSYPVALTVTMSLFTLLPYLLFSWLLLRKGKGFQALLILSVLLLLPVEFGMITAISRGLMPGILLASFAILALFTSFRLQYAAFGFLGVLALFANPSSVILLFPAGIWLLAENFKNKSFYLQSLAGAIPAAVLWFLAVWFYKQHPEYVVHGSWSLGASLKIIKPYEWDKFFNYVTPLFWNLGWLIFPLLIALGLILIRQKEKKAGYALLAGVVLLFFSLTLFKVHHGFPTVFLSWARMYVAIPLLIAVFVSRIHLSPKLERYVPVIVLVSGTFFVIKCASVKNVAHREIEEKTEHAMYVSDISSLQKLCDTIGAVAHQNRTELIVVGNHYTKHLITYGCPCLREDMPVIIEPALDRRTWLLDREENQVKKNVLFVGFFEDLLPKGLQNNPNVTKLSQEPLMLLLRDNTLPTGQMLDAVGFPLRPH